MPCEVSSRPLRIAICDDSAAYSRALTAFVERDDSLKVTQTFSSAEDLLARLDGLDAELVIMDLEMPGIGGVAGITQIMAERPLPVLVISGHGPRSERVAEALSAGALEAIPKDALRLARPDDLWATALRSRIRRLASVRLSRRPRGGRIGPTPPRSLTLDRPLRAIAIGASTGGPPALAEILGAMSADFPLPILVVQHIAAGFSAGLVTWLNRQVAMPVAFASQGAAAGPGVWFAPDDAHLGLDQRGRFALDRTTVRGAHRPSVDMLLESLAATVGDAALAVILTGMGRDGAEGVRTLRAAGGIALAQDQPSSAVFGMPRAAIENGADRVLALEAIGPTLARLRPVALPA